MAVEKFINLMMKRHKPVSPQRQPQSSPLKQTVKRKVVVQLTRFEKFYT